VHAEAVFHHSPMYDWGNVWMLFGRESCGLDIYRAKEVHLVTMDRFPRHEVI